jgi:hypothetical protein
MEPDPIALATELPPDYRSALLELELRLAERKKKRKEPSAEVAAVGRAATVYRLEALDGLLVKRFAPFESTDRRDFYARSVDAYARLLASPIGLSVAPHQCEMVDGSDGPMLYIIQPEFPHESIADRIIGEADESMVKTIVGLVLNQTLKVWHRNAIEREIHTHDSQIGLDARLSNWSIDFEGDSPTAVFFDTGTPFIRRLGKDRIDPEIFPDHIPVSPGTFLNRRKPEEELDRYYDFRLVLTDLLAEIGAIDPKQMEIARSVVNDFLASDAEDLQEDPIEADEIKKAIKTEKKRREASGR